MERSTNERKSKNHRRANENDSQRSVSPSSLDGRERKTRLQRLKDKESNGGRMNKIDIKSKEELLEMSTEEIKKLDNEVWEYWKRINVVKEFKEA